MFFTHKNKKTTTHKNQKLNDSLMSGRSANVMKNKLQKARLCSIKTRSVFGKHVKSIISTADLSGWAKKRPQRQQPERDFLDQPTKCLVSILAG